jgi:hypothetical protein
MHDEDPVLSRSKSPKSSRQPEAEKPESEFQSPAFDPDRMPEPWVPESKLPPAPAGYPFISFVRNILLTNPLFPKFYADVVLSSAPNSNEAKILRPQYQNLVRKVNEKVNQMSNAKTCTHIKVTGVRCGSPSLYGESFCYFHQHAHRGVRKPPQSRLHPMAIIEDEESIQASLMEVINALMRNTIDLKRAELILRALHIAVKNARRSKFEGHSAEVVRQVPEYQQPAQKNVDISADAPEPELDVPYTAMIPPPDYAEIEAERQRARKAEAERDRQAEIRAKLERASIARSERTANVQPAHVVTAHVEKENVGTADVGPAHLGTGHVGTAHVGTGAIARPATPSAAKVSALSPSAIGQHNYNKPANPAADPTPRKPVSRAPQAPKERKIAAHRASGA